MAAAIRVIAAGDSSEMSAPAARPMTRLIALPFRVLRPDAETDFLAFSLPDAITSSLAGTRNLLVRSSAAAARFDPQAPDLRKLAADADVDVALMGTILRAGSQLRATAQLVEAPAGTVVWSHAAQHPLQDVFALQDELVGGIVASLSQSLGDQGSRVGRRDVPRNAEAYELYLRGNELARDWDRIPEAREVYQRCVTLDSQFAPAWAGLGPLPARDREVPSAGRRDRRGRADPSSGRRASIQTCRSCTSTTRSSSAMPAARSTRCGGCCDGPRRRSIRSSSPDWSMPAATPACSTRRWPRTRRPGASTRPSRPACSTPTACSATGSGSSARLPDVDRDITALALYRMGRKAEALAAWPGMPFDASPAMKLWDDSIRACSDRRARRA